MIKIFILFLIVSYARTASLNDRNSQIVLFENRANENGYHFRYETSDGTSRSEEGLIQEKNDILKVKGQYSYSSPNGRNVKVKYTADENGFNPYVKISNENVTLSSPTLPELPPLPPKQPQLPPAFISSAAIASLAGGGLGK